MHLEYYLPKIFVSANCVSRQFSLEYFYDLEKQPKIHKFVIRNPYALSVFVQFL